MAGQDGLIAAGFRRRMDELGLDVEDVAARAQVGIATYDLVESADDAEFYGVWDLWMVKRVVDALELNLLDVLELKCVFCEKDLEQWRDLAGHPRNDIIRTRRADLGLSMEGLLTKIGWTQWAAGHRGEYNHEWSEGVTREYRAMENSPNSIEQLPLERVMLVAEGIEVPAQLLLGVRCLRCGARKWPLRLPSG
jgi:hypothetical protein